jgi:DDE superfamily endonuclease
MLQATLHTYIGESHLNIKVVYLPPNTTSILQPMDQGGIANFKVYYLRIAFAQAIAGTEREFWKNYNILHAIKNISEGWSNVTTTCMNGIWNKLLKRFNNNMNFNIEEVTNIIVQFSQKLNLEVDNEDVNQLLENDVEELTNQDLIEIEEQRVGENNVMELEKLNEHEEPPKKLALKEMAAAFSQLMR